MSYRYPLDVINITQGFGENAIDYSAYGQLGHNGIDLGCNVVTPVYASENGTVYFEGWGQNSSWMGAIAGICVIVDHGAVYTGYAHMSSTVVNKGDFVKKSQLIGYSGSTGKSTGGHVHFEFIGKPPVWNNGYAGRLNPKQFNIGVTDMVTDKTQLNKMYIALLHRTRGAGEGEDVYLGKDSGFVFNDIYNAPERARTLANEAKLPKVITVEKPVEVIKEVIKEVPVEVIKQIGFDEMTLGEVLIQVWKKIARIK